MLVHFNHDFLSRSGGVIYDIVGLFPGVPVFFFISGFLIPHSYISSGLKNYLLKRAFRIFPALFFSVLISVFLLIYFDQIIVKKFPYLWFLSQVSFLQFINPAEFRDYGTGVVNGALWTISVELQFYVLTPFIVYIYAYSKRLILIIALISICSNVFANLIIDTGGILSKLIRISFLPWISYFIFGWLSRDLIVHLRGKDILSLFMIFLVSYLLLYGFKSVGNSIAPPLGLLLGFSVLGSSRFFSSSRFSWIEKNDLSYSIYLVHMLVIGFLIEVGISRAPFLIVPYFVLCLFLSLISWFLIERPSLVFGRSVVKKIRNLDRD